MATFVPTRLREIIIIRNRRLDELAERVGVTKQAISKYTHGKSVPSQDMFNRLVTELHIPPSFLMWEKPYSEELASPLFFRASSSTTQTAKEFAGIISGWGYEIALAVGAVGGETLPPIPENLNVYDKALYLRSLWGLGSEPIDDMVSLLESQGFWILTAESAELNTAAYSQIICGVPIIVINQNKGSAVDQRLSLAHELGHLVLHNRLSKTAFGLNRKSLEAEASSFASEFLLPSINYKAFIGCPNLHLLLPLKQNWKMSLTAMLYHCKEKGFFSPAKAKRLQVQLSKKWGRMAEPFDDEIQKEKPSKLAHKVMSTIHGSQDFQAFASNLPLPMETVASLLSLPQGYFDGFTLPLSGMAPLPDDFQPLSLFGSEAIPHA